MHHCPWCGQPCDCDELDPLPCEDCAYECIEDDEPEDEDED